MTNRSRFGQAGLRGLCRRCRPQSASAISAIPMGMPGCPDLAASTASIASARIAFASSRSDAAAVIWEPRRRQKRERGLYRSVSYNRQHGNAVHDPAELRRGPRNPARPRSGARRLVHLPRRPAARRNGTAGAGAGRSTHRIAPGMGPPGVAKTPHGPQFIGVHAGSDTICRVPGRDALLGRRSPCGRGRAARERLGGTPLAFFGAVGPAFRRRRASVAAPRLGPHAPVLRALRRPYRGKERLAREVEEEVGLRVSQIRYFASQPWPFPHSLMIAFVCDWESGEIHPREGEIEAAHWFDVLQLPKLPSRISISRRLIDAVTEEMRTGLA